MASSSTSFRSLSSPSSRHRTSFVGCSPPSEVNFRRSFAVRAAVNTHTSSFYDVLGIQDGATCQEIKSAYRRLARVLHPDVLAGTSSGHEDATAAAVEFMRVHEAYATLSDPYKRADYDRKLLFKRHSVRYSPNYAISTPKNATSSYSCFSGYTRRNWETDQCW